MSLFAPHEMKQKKIAVLMGGLSAEREISLKTGAACLNALQQLGYQAVPVDVDQELAEQLKTEQVEVAFIALHGRFGEDGTVQGMLEMLQIPYTGSGVLASSLAIDKVVTKKMLLYHELPTPGFEFMRPCDSSEQLFERCKHLPLIVKPSREGSTIGITIARSREALRHGIYPAATLRAPVLV